jgi:hypothetical protein
MSVERPMEPFLPSQGLQEPLEIEFLQQQLNGETDDGGVIIDLDPNAPEDLTNVPHEANLAEYIDDSDLQAIASDLISDYMADEQSRSEWKKTYIEGLDLLGLKFEERNKPWAGACGVFHPMLAEAVVRFQANTAQEIFPASGPAKVKLVGSKSTERLQQANRVQEYMNYVAVEEMPEYRTETEKLLFSLPLAGSAFRKVYQDPSRDRPVSMFVPAEDFVVSYGTSDLESCERATHVMKRTPNQVRKLQVSGFYRDIDLGEPSIDISEIVAKYDEMTGSESTADADDRHTLLEMKVVLDLPGFEDPTKVFLPYMVTIDKASGNILSIYRNWIEEDPNKNPRVHFVHYEYIPGLGFYGFGLVHMIGGLTKSATSLLRQLIDSGTLANLPGGIKTKGLRIKGDDTPIMPGEFRDADLPMGSIRDNIAFLPYKEPSTVLYQLLGDLVQEGRRFASAADLKASDINGEAPVGTTLALLEREMKVLSAVMARVHAAMGRELRLLAGLIKDYGPEKYPYETEEDVSLQEDFSGRIDVIPVSDPNAGTMAQRIMQHQAAMQMAAQNPGIYDLPLLNRQMIEVLGLADADKIVPTDEDLKPTDPITEDQNMMNGKPVKVFEYQDHEAHIQVHMATLQNPQIQQMMQQNPQAQTVQAAFAAHVTAHVAMGYRQKIEQELGIKLPAPDEHLPEDIEHRLSRLVAPAAAQLTGKAQQQAQAEENAKKQEDPVIQLQQKELEIKQQALDAKEREAQQKAQTEAKKSEDRKEIEQAKLIAQMVMKLLDQQTKDRQQSAKERQEGFDSGLKLADRVLDAAKDDND